MASDLSQIIIIVVMCVAVVGLMVFSGRNQKKRQQETMKMLDAIRPGNKVKTIGGICGIVVEVCPEDNTFVLETGSEESGKSYIKFDKQAVYQTDAVVSEEAPVEEAPVEENKTEEPFEEVAEPAEEASVEEAPAEESKDAE